MKRINNKMELYQEVDRMQLRLIKWLWLYKLKQQIKEAMHHE